MAKVKGIAQHRDVIHILSYVKDLAKKVDTMGSDLKEGQRVIANVAIDTDSDQQVCEETTKTPAAIPPGPASADEDDNRRRM